MSIEEDVRNAVLKYSDMLYKICIVILCNEQDVQDAIQDTFCRYMEKKPNFRAEGGISEEEAIEIATKQMAAELGERAEGKEILKYEDGSVAVIIQDISGQTDYEHKGDVAYNVIFSNPNDHSTYYCVIDAVDGSIFFPKEAENCMPGLHLNKLLIFFVKLEDF